MYGVALVGRLEHFGVGVPLLGRVGHRHAEREVRELVERVVGAEEPARRRERDEGARRGVVVEVLPGEEVELDRDRRVERAEPVGGAREVEVGPPALRYSATRRSLS